MPVPNSFTTTANQVTFLDGDGDRIVMRASVVMGKPVIRMYTDRDGIHLPTTCSAEFIEAIQHLTNRAKEMADATRPVSHAVTGA